VTRSGFYAWQRRPESAHARRDRHLRVRVRASHEASRRAYGRPRIWNDLVEEGERVSEKRVGRLMREDGIVARTRRRFKTTTMSDHDQLVAANVLDRQFTADAPNQRWVGDTSEFLVGHGTKLFVAAILDLFSRYVVGWAVSAVNDRHLTIKALEMAIKRRCPETGLLHHSDQGCTYASEDDQRWLTTYGITCSMSRRGNCYDNAVMESFFSTVKLNSASTSRAAGRRRCNCLTTSKCSTTSGGAIRRWVRSARRPTSVASPQPRSDRGRSAAATRERRMLIPTPPTACRLSTTNDDDTRTP
jgi:transposase InsO family protein